MRYSRILVSNSSLESPHRAYQNVLFRKKKYIRFDPKRFRLSFIIVLGRFLVAVSSFPPQNDDTLLDSDDTLLDSYIRLTISILILLSVNIRRLRIIDRLSLLIA